jgi:hypothetical protein
LEDVLEIVSTGKAGDCRNSAADTAANSARALGKANGADYWVMTPDAITITAGKIANVSKKKLIWQ